VQSLVRNNALHDAQAHLRPPATSAGGWSEACRQWTGRGSNTHSTACDRTMTAFSVSLEVTGMAMIITHRHPAEPQHARPDFLSGAPLVVACGTGRGTSGARALPYAHGPRNDRYRVLKTTERRLPGTSTTGVSREVGCTPPAKKRCSNRPKNSHFSHHNLH